MKCSPPLLVFITQHPSINIKEEKTKKSMASIKTRNNNNNSNKKKNRKQQSTNKQKKKER